MSMSDPPGPLFRFVLCCLAGLGVLFLILLATGGL
jgi:hypothetical protein